MGFLDSDIKLILLSSYVFIFFNAYLTLYTALGYADYLYFIYIIYYYTNWFDALLVNKCFLNGLGPFIFIHLY